MAAAVVTAFGIPAASGPAAATAARASVENGTAVTAPAAPSRLKPAKCVAANRSVGLTASASKKIKGSTYGVKATRVLTLCTTKKNQTKVYGAMISLEPVNGLVKVKVSAGTTTRVVSGGVTTLTTPLTAKGTFFFTTYRVVGTLRTVVDGSGKVTSQIVKVKRV